MTINTKIALIASILFTGQVAIADCSKFLNDVLDNAASWRAEDTHSMLPGGQFLKTDPDREKQLKASYDEMWNEIKVVNDVPPLDYFPASGVDVVKKEAPGDWMSGNFGSLTVRNLGPDGELPITLVLPVSGHVGFENATKWAKEDKIFLYKEIVETVDGRQRSASKYVIENVQSKNYVTYIDVILKLEKGKNRFLYHRNGNRPGGYIEGRVLEVFWDGT